MYKSSRFFTLMYLIFFLLRKILRVLWVYKKQIKKEKWK